MIFKRCYLKLIEILQILKWMNTSNNSFKRFGLLVSILDLATYFELKEELILKTTTRSTDPD